MTTKAFKINENYEMFSPCDQSCTWAYKVLARTAKTVTLAKLDDVNKVVIVAAGGGGSVYGRRRRSGRTLQTDAVCICDPRNLCGIGTGQSVHYP